MNAITATKWRRRAWGFAREAHLYNHSSRRGWFPLRTPTQTLLVLYNNNPYSHGPHIREGETRKLREWLKEQSFADVAYATYPNRGEDAGYSYAMILDVPEELHLKVVNKVRELVSESWAQMNEERAVRIPEGGRAFRVIEGGGIDVKLPHPEP